ncbi:hypothetical protein [Bradyrhizobium sp. 2TAF24]|uniref:hypothetical protein n=1 Tax=Bradyrhizobium sp. 2TAF24 TaxID=3233011 RepID=UPI003F93B49E
MPIAKLSVVTLILSLSTATAHAEFYSKVAASGATIRLYRASSTNPDCSTAGEPIVRLTQSPQHGRIRLARTRVYINFPPNNLRSACNRSGVRGVLVSYVSQRGYTGPDSAAIDVFYPSGNVRQASFDIAVR